MNPSTPIAPKEGQQTPDWRKLADDLANEIVTEVPDLAPEMILNFAEKYSARLVARCAELERVITALDAAGNILSVDIEYAAKNKVFLPPSYLKILQQAQVEARAALALKPEASQ